MKSRALAVVVALFISQVVIHSARSEDELVGPPPLAEELPPQDALPPQFERLPPVDLGSPLTLMQWSYGDGADDPWNVYPGAIETDRPYFTKTASVVGLNHSQFEMGTTYARNPYRGQSVVSFPEALLRFGALAEWLEFRVGWNWIQNGHISRWGSYSDASCPYVGMKIALAPQDDALPQMALLIDADMPTHGIAPESLDELQPGLTFLYHWDLADGYEMGGATEFRRIADDRSPTSAFAQSWIFERHYTESLTCFGEWFMVSVDRPSVDAQHSLDTGLLYTLSENVQLDAIVGLGLTPRAYDYFVGSGVSVRW